MGVSCDEPGCQHQAAHIPTWALGKNTSVWKSHGRLARTNILHSEVVKEISSFQPTPH